MRPLPLLVACLLVCLQVISCRGSEVRGVPPDSQSLYAGPSLSCDGGKVQLTPSMINDDYCDCPESGFDEPGTSACSAGIFYCLNAGHVSASVPSSFVNDGICDCCDGSDEWANLNGVSCPNNCKELAREAWKVTLEQIEVTKKGLQKKKKMIDQAQGKWSEMNAKVQLLDTELKQLQAQVDQLISLRKEEEERIESERAKAVEEELHANPREDQSVDEQGTVMDESEVSPDEAEENNVGDNADESFPYPKEYRFDEDSEAYDDVDVDDLDENDEDGLDEFDTAGENGLDEIDAHTDSISDEITIDVPRNTEDEPGKSIFDKLMDSAYSLFSRITGSGTSDHKDNLTKLNDQISKMESETSKRTRELEELKNTLGYDFGAQKEFMPLSEECFTIRQKQYTYEFCPFKSMYQKEGSGSTSLGRFEGWKQNSDELIMEFRNGQRCWNGPARSADVAMICGSKNELISADEPSTCVYTFSFRTPAACDEVSLERLVASIPQGF